jgi:ABC-2 type transport system permease protein
MMEAAQALRAIRQPQNRPPLYWWLSDSWELCKRTLVQVRRTPGEVISLVIMQPVLLIVLFRYVFGGAVETGGVSYADFLIPGVIAANCALVGTTAAVGVAKDISSGIVDRFRSLPMARSAILGGTVMANTVRSMIALVAMVLMGVLVGFRPEADAGEWLVVLGLMALVSYAFSWLMAIIGMIAGSEEAAYQMSALLWPLAFASSAFVPPESMPSPLEEFAANQPISVAVDAGRALLLDQPVGDHLWVALVWCAGITLTSVVVATMLFRRRFD